MKFSNINIVTFYYILTLGDFLSGTKQNRVLTISRNAYYKNLVPSQKNLFLRNMSEVSLAKCVIFCVVYGSDCVGIFFNRNSRTCSLMSLPENMELLLEHQTGSEYYSLNQCEIGWHHFNHNCYYINETKTIWENARLQCLQKSAHLAEIESETESKWVIANLLPRECPLPWYKCTIYIGGNDRSVEGTFVWSNDNRPLKFTNWSPVEPNSDSPEDDCIVLLYPGGAWADFGCTAERSFICKKHL